MSRKARASWLFDNAPWLPVERFIPPIEGEGVDFRSRDGCTLRGTYLRTNAPVRHGVILFCHELNSDRWGVAPYAASLCRRGYDVFTYDQRNHGTSDCDRCFQPTPWVSRSDVDDLRQAIRYLSDRDDVDSTQLGLMGVSRGGMISLCAASEEKDRVCSVVVDSACIVQGQVGRASSTWRRWVIGLWCGCRFVNLRQMLRTVPQPILWIQGERDSYQRIDATESFQLRMRRKPKFWVVSDADHAGAVDVATNEYHSRVSRFFKQHMTPQPLEPPHNTAPQTETVEPSPVPKPIAILRKA